MEEMELKEKNFEEERKEIIKRNEPRRKAIHDILSKRQNIEESLLDILLKEKEERKTTQSPPEMRSEEELEIVV